MKCLIIYSPFAKRGCVKRYLNKMKTTLLKTYHVVDFMQTQAPRHATKLAKQYAPYYDTIVSAGGDGILHEIVNGILLSKATNKPNLGIIPLGTANDVAHTLGIPKNINRALQVLTENHKLPYDIMQINDQFGIYELSLGQGTCASYTTKQKAKQLLGWVSYLWDATKNAFKPHNHPVTLCVNGKPCESIPVSFLLVLNSKAVAGFLLHRQNKQNDGMVTVLTFAGMRGLFGWFRASFQLIGMFLFGVNHIKNNKTCTVYHNVTNLTLSNPSNQNINVDGELFGTQTELNVNVKPNALQVIAKRR